MENSSINVEQILFGYSNGHHLLKSSILLTERTQKMLEILSDLTGPDVQSGFVEYITGYPLENEGYYTLSKTWYASEMQRPGCVWTHMLLFKYDDLSKVKSCNDLLSVFTRPNLHFNNYSYSKTIEIEYNEDFNKSESVSIDKLRFIEWAVYTNCNPIVIPSNSASEYGNEICYFWMNQEVTIMKDFSFCTGVLANRNIEKKTIDLQIVPYNILRSIGRQNKELKIIDISLDKVDYPMWVDYLIGPSNFEIILNFNEFRNIFGKKYLGKHYFSKFARIFTETGIITGNARIDEFSNLVSALFLKEEAFFIKCNVLQQLLKNNKLDWFGYSSIIEAVIDISIKMDLSDFNTEYILLDQVVNLLWDDYFDKICYIFNELTSNNINFLGEQLIKSLALRALPEQLQILTGMKLNLCSLMVKLDVKFALSESIWYQSKDFQINIINCIQMDTSNINQAQQIIRVILENSSFEFSDLIYEKFGDLAILTFLDWYVVTDASDEKKLNWIKICEKNPSQFILWIKNTNKSIDKNLLLKLVNILDPCSIEAQALENSFWINIFYNINIRYLDDEFKSTLAKFFIQIILLKEATFPVDFVKFSFDIIYSKISKQELDYETWSKLDKILPEAMWYNNWDKCKRLQKALKLKGYKI